MIGDDFHFILECPSLQHLQEHFYINIVKEILTHNFFLIRFSTQNINILDRLCKYIIEASKLIKFCKHFNLLVSE